MVTGISHITVFCFILTFSPFFVSLSQGWEGGPLFDFFWELFGHEPFVIYERILFHAKGYNYGAAGVFSDISAKECISGMDKIFEGGDVCLIMFLTCLSMFVPLLVDLLSTIP